MEKAIIKIQELSLLALAIVMVLSTTGCLLLSMPYPQPHVLGKTSCLPSGYCETNDDCCSGKCISRSIISRIPFLRSRGYVGTCQPTEIIPQPTKYLPQPTVTKTAPKNCPDCQTLQRNLQTMLDNISCPPFAADLDRLLKRVNYYCANGVLEPTVTASDSAR